MPRFSTLALGQSSLPLSSTAYKVTGMQGKLVFALAVLHMHFSHGGTGIMDDERLLHSSGQWHRDQRKQVAFETSCYYTHEPELPYGCQYAASLTNEWTQEPLRASQKGHLAELYDKTHGYQWVYHDNWLQGDPCWDSWYGITCDEHGYIIKIELVDNSLLGTLPEAIGLIPTLLKIDLSSTSSYYHGHNNTHKNYLRGALPSFASCPRLEEIEISGNLINELPRDLYANAGTLRLLSASRNRLRDLPRFLLRFTKLHTLELGHNRINDVFPEDFAYLTNMRFLQLEYNQLTGTIWRELSQMNRVRVFDISHNPDLAGELPQELIVSWREIEYLSVLNTSTSGYIASLCLDVPFCYKYMFDTHRDMTWATPDNVPDVVNDTITLARAAR